MAKEISTADFSGLAVFSDDAIVTEEANGLKISDDGAWSSQEFNDATEYMQKFQNLEMSVDNLKNIMSKGGDGATEVQNDGDSMTVVNENASSFDSMGNVKAKKVKCPNCGKEVDALQKNGYCSKSCAAKARAERALNKIGSCGQDTVDMIKKVQSKLQLLDMALNIITEFPEMIKGLVKLPKQYRDYVMLRIDILFMEMKRIINVIMILKNEAIIKVLQKMRIGALDEKMKVIFQPINAMLQVIIGIQQALNVAMQVIINLLKMPMYGLKPMSYGWFMTAKSMLYAETSGKILIEIEPKMNLALPLPNMMNIMDYKLIQTICNAALPPLQDFEYFLEPTAFKIRYALSQDNTPRVKKLYQMLEGLCVQGADTFPRWKRLKLTNIWFVLSILTGWGPLSRGVYGDFIFHGAI